jgi:iron complex outermembrane receptor protein
MKRIHMIHVLAAAALLAVLPSRGFSQAPEGRITGTIKDASGAPAAGATVTATSRTGASRITTTAGDGSFTAAGLAPGVYTVTVELKGFARATRADVRVAADAPARLDVTLESLKLEEELTVTGSRVRGRTATETASPVDTIDNLTIRSTGATETGKILQLLAPSFNFSTTTISDGTDIIRPATLRALGPDQVLVLVNGRRRHQQALLNVQQTVARGSAGYDINSIPASAIDHIEVLRDGAAAQYGSDAIAGVINVILKRAPRTTDVTLEAGQTYESDGGVGLLAANKGFAWGDRGFFNVTGEFRDRGETNRAGPDSLRVSPAAVTQRIGDPDARDFALWLNAEHPLGAGTFYAFGGYSDRRGDSSGFFRTAGDGRTVPDLYPNGFLPNLITKPRDISASAGYRGRVAAAWNYDLSANYGKSRFKFREENTVNVSYWYEPQNPALPEGPRVAESATEADTGTLGYDQFTLNADFTRAFDWGVGAGPLNLGAGVEWRQEGYTIEAGEEISYEYGRTNDRSIRILDQTGGIAQPGTQGFPGWSPQEAVDGDRNNFALYADLESLLAKKLLVGAAARFENYSDFGSTITGKLQARYNFSEKASLRGTFSTGFRAPSVQQTFYSQRSTNLNSAGVLTDTLTARQDGDVTRAFGIPALEEETSRNYSLGLVLRPIERLRITADYYNIDIDDRIVFSSNVQPEDPATCGTPFDPALCPIGAILNPLGVGQVLFFTNAIDTRTKGFDLVALYDFPAYGGTLSLEGVAHFNDTEVTDRRSSSTILDPAALFDQTQVTLIEEGQPRKRFTVGGQWARNGWRADLRFNYFGEVAGEGFTPGIKQTWGGKWLTDVSVTMPIRRNRLDLTVGALNVFNVYPDKWDLEGGFPFPQLGFVYGWETLPFGINGGYYFARLNLRLDR